MTAYRTLCAALLVSGLTFGAALAQSNGDGPAEQPPAGFAGTQFVDSAGCVYVRAGMNGSVTWAPRLDADRQPLCDANPTVTTAAPAVTVVPAKRVERTRRVIRSAGHKIPIVPPRAGMHHRKRSGIPSGFRAAWDDGRLNPHRGPHTPSGTVQMNRVWTSTVPRRLKTD